MGVPGEQLFRQIEGLKGKISVNEVVIDGLHKIRIFGNQGGHSGSGRYEKVDAETVEIAIEMIKRLVQAAYQDRDVVARLDQYLLEHPASPAE